jgi:hypothetical protein
MWVAGEVLVGFYFNFNIIQRMRAPWLSLYFARFHTRAPCRCGAVPPTEVSYSTRAAVVHTTTLVH